MPGFDRALMFSSTKDEWATPQHVFDALHQEFHFVLDAAATPENAKCPNFLTAEQDALRMSWCYGGAVWLNCPYSRVREFIAKAAEEARKGLTVVCLVPARTDTRWFFDHVYDASTNQFRPGVEVRFLKGRLKFGDSANSAPFPSVLIIFRGQP